MLKKESGESKQGGKALIVIGLITIILLLLVIIALLISKMDGNENNDEVEVKRDVVINENNVEEVAEELLEVEQVRPGSYEVTMNGVWNFKDGSSASENAYVENSTANTNDVYFDVLLADTEEVIYESPLIPVGSYLENITLDKVLEAGTYDCVMIYHLVDENQKTLSTLRVTLTLVIAE